MIRIVVCAALVFFAGVAGTSAAADPILSFEVSAATLGEGNDLSGQLSLEVLFLDASDQVSFTFTNDVTSGSASSITDIYFRQGDTTSGNTITEGIGFEDYMEGARQRVRHRERRCEFLVRGEPGEPAGRHRLGGSLLGRLGIRFRGYCCQRRERHGRVGNAHLRPVGIQRDRDGCLHGLRCWAFLMAARKLTVSSPFTSKPSRRTARAPPTSTSREFRSRSRSSCSVPAWSASPEHAAAGVLARRRASGVPSACRGRVA